LFELLLAEWGLDPVYITENWTDELLNLMVNKLADRKHREARTTREPEPDTVPASMLFARASNLVKVVKE